MMHMTGVVLAGVLALISVRCWHGSFLVLFAVSTFP
jgi:hypothetical protein